MIIDIQGLYGILNNDDMNDCRGLSHFEKEGWRKAKFSAFNCVQIHEFLLNERKQPLRSFMASLHFYIAEKYQRRQFLRCLAV